MATIRVKNVLNRHDARTLRKQLKRHIQGTFLKVGDRKIPIGKMSEVDERFIDQITLLCSMGVLEIVDSSTPVSSPRVQAAIDRSIQNREMERSIKHTQASAPPAPPVVFTPAETLEFDDFIIITSKKKVVEDVVPPVKEEPVTVKKEEVVSDIVTFSSKTEDTIPDKVAKVEDSVKVEDPIKVVDNIGGKRRGRKPKK